LPTVPGFSQRMAPVEARATTATPTMVKFDARGPDR